MTARLLLSGLILGCTACAARPSGDAMPASYQEPQPDPTDLDALERDLALQEARLDQALGPRLALRQAPAEPSTSVPAAGAPAPPPAPAETAPASRAPDAYDADDERLAEGEQGAAEAQSSKDKREEASPCETGCRAVASMRRSAEAICRLSGAAHARCQYAGQRVSEAAQRLEQARCTCG